MHFCLRLTIVIYGVWDIHRWQFWAWHWRTMYGPPLLSQRGRYGAVCNSFWTWMEMLSYRCGVPPSFWTAANELYPQTAFSYEYCSENVRVLVWWDLHTAQLADWWLCLEHLCVAMACLVSSCSCSFLANVYVDMDGCGLAVGRNHANLGRNFSCSCGPLCTVWRRRRWSRRLWRSKMDLTLS